MTTKLSTPECSPGARSANTFGEDGVEPQSRNFSLLGKHVSYLRAVTPKGWGHQEGELFAHALVSVATLTAPGQAQAVRIVVGRHSFWIFPKDPAPRAPAGSDVQKSADVPAGKARGLNLGRFRLRHLRSTSPAGWGHDEVDCFARTRFSLTTLISDESAVTWRLVAGIHSFWIFR